MSWSTRQAWRDEERRLQDAYAQLGIAEVPQDDPEAVAAYARLEAHHDNQPLLDRIGQIADRLRGLTVSES